jgi:hypothetical protein
MLSFKITGNFAISPELKFKVGLMLPIILGNMVELSKEIKYGLFSRAPKIQQPPVSKM